MSVNVTPVRMENHVDINRFMGDWHVITNIPPLLAEQGYDISQIQKVPQRWPE